MVVLTLVCMLGFGAILVRLVDVQVMSAGRFADLGRSQRIRSVDLPAQRGSIFDRNGADLAVSVRRPTVWADPRAIVDPGATAFALADVLGTDVNALRDLLSQDSAFVYVARRTDDATGQAVADLDLPGIGVYEEADRVEPAGSLASPVIGSVGVDGDGLSGLEQLYDETLRGRNGERVVERDPSGREIAGGAEREVAPEKGSDLVLTVDRDLQFAVEQILGGHVAEAGARAGVAVVMDPTTGEILAMASMAGGSDGFDQASYNMALVDVFEPGSVAKVIPLSGAVQERAIGPQQVLSVPDTIEVSDGEFSDFSPHPVEAMTPAEIMAASSNVGTIMIAQALGAERLASYIDAFGFGRPTGIGFPGESDGLVPERSGWSGTSLATLALGQGLALNSVQVLGAYNVIANQGLATSPRLVSGIIDPDGATDSPGLDAPRRVVSAETAASVREMLVEAVRSGTGRAAAIEGYTVAGKTGTARKVVEGVSGYKEKAYVATFAGFFPAEAPKVSIVVVLDEPTPYTGGEAAAPVFAEIARFAARHLQVPPATTATIEPSSTRP